MSTALSAPPLPPIVTACIVIIGNEILSGRTQDENVAFLAKALNQEGVSLREVRVIPDIPDTIVDTVNEVRAKFDYVITTGGIGPTHDDITPENVARAFGVPLLLNPEAHRILLDHYKTGELNAARLRMAHAPEGATLIANPISRAPGFQLGNVFVLAGIPRVMQAMFDDVKLRLKGGAPVLSRTVNCGLAEGILAKGLGEIQSRFTDLDLGSYPWYRQGSFGVSLVLRGRDAARLDLAVGEVAAMVRELGGAPVVE